MARPKLTLYLDVVSPFAYFAFHVIRNSPTFAPCDITYTPIFLGGVMQATGNRPPIEIKNKDKFVALDRDRWASRFAIPMGPGGPKPFPQMTLGVMRAVCAVSLKYPSELENVFAALYEKFWVDLEPISKAEVFGPVVLRVLGEARGKEVLALAGGKEAKDLLKRNSEMAVEEGAFGLPWFVCVDGEGRREAFWGFDHLGLVVDFLGLRRGDEGFRAML
ncbi:putative 2-hydroxychromene-2-carboxylate isomerase [Teratosphaeria nubilosa]|uniref:Glutathione S-transferase kappa n=1 Tax=Teratosphaeria nubilosa TaxID=161662 RepID=A0A6G1LAL6_9PEZI|nr:putative 2-hydroxychromene-2-carboxylate isomerase [Teratosphaeria nubilosa]